MRERHSPLYQGKRKYIVPPPELGTYRGQSEQRAREIEQRRGYGPPKLMKYSHPRWNSNGSGEAEVVHGQQLSVVLKKWIVEWLSDRPLNEARAGQAFSKRENRAATAMGPIQFLAEKTEIHIRRVSAICNGEMDFVPWSQADKLLQACNLTHLTRNNEIQVISNPNWSMERWIAYMQERRGSD